MLHPLSVSVSLRTVISWGGLKGCSKIILQTQRSDVSVLGINPPKPMSSQGSSQGLSQSQPLPSSAVTDPL